MQRLCLGLWLLFSLLLAAEGRATELMPWFDKDREFELRTSYAFQHYHRIARKSTLISRPAYNHFCQLSLGISKDDRLNAEIEGSLAATRDHSFNLECGRLTLRCKFLDDVIGDQLSLVGGVTFIAPTKLFLHDISCMFHGEYAWEGHLAIGKEQVCRSFWTTRWWGVFKSGLANRGSPWVSLLAAWEKNYFNQHQWRIYAEVLAGMGQRPIPLNLHMIFPGYDSIKHRSADVGVRYSYLTPCSATLTLEWAWRLYAYNFPANANKVLCTLLYSFGL